MNRASPYAGLVTRTVAFALDVALAQGVVLLVGVVIGLVVEAFGKFSPHVDLGTVVLGAAAWTVMFALYQMTFWALTAQTPGMRALGIELRTTQGDRVRPRRALLRLGAEILAALPLFAGFYVPILMRDDRRGLHDLIAGTVVLYVEPKRPPARGRPRESGLRAAPHG